MQPTRWQYFVASSWPTTIWFTTGVLAAVALVVREIGFRPPALMDWQAALWLAVAITVAIPAGWFASLFAGLFVLGPLYYDQGLKNGAPFQPGDAVRILRRPHRDVVTRVYQTWQGDTVRVELGDAACAAYQDIFAPCELLRETEPDSRVDGGSH